jgi:hypothetical protein
MRVWNRHVGIAPILTSLALTLTWMPAPLHASDLYVATGKLVDVRTGTVLTDQCISITNDKITAVAPCGATPIFNGDYTDDIGTRGRIIG